MLARWCCAFRFPWASRNAEEESPSDGENDPYSRDCNREGEPLIVNATVSYLDTSHEDRQSLGDGVKGAVGGSVMVQTYTWPSDATPRPRERAPKHRNFFQRLLRRESDVVLAASAPKPVPPQYPRAAASMSLSLASQPQEKQYATDDTLHGASLKSPAGSAPALVSSPRSCSTEALAESATDALAFLDDVIAGKIRGGDGANPDGRSATALRKPSAKSVAGADGKRRGYTSSAARSLKEYELVAYLGTGTFAEVTLARQRATQKLYAVKKINKWKVKEEGCIQRTFTERQLLASLNHPFLVSLHQAFQSGAHLYLVLDFAQGGDLFSFMSKKQWDRDMRSALKKFQLQELRRLAQRQHRRGRSRALCHRSACEIHPEAVRRLIMRTPSEADRALVSARRGGHRDFPEKSASLAASGNVTLNASIGGTSAPVLKGGGSVIHLLVDDNAAGSRRNRCAGPEGLATDEAKVRDKSESHCSSLHTLGLEHLSSSSQHHLPPRSTVSWKSHSPSADPTFGSVGGGGAFFMSASIPTPKVLDDASAEPFSAPKRRRLPRPLSRGSFDGRLPMYHGGNAEHIASSFHVDSSRFPTTTADADGRGDHHTHMACWSPGHDVDGYDVDGADGSTRVEFATVDDGRMPIQHIFYYATEIALVLTYLHKKGFVYRDLKPENILMDHDGHLMLTDFGVAKFRQGNGANPPAANASSGENTGDEKGRTSSFTGTAQYMSPEMLQGLPHDSRTDWWSYGCLLFEMCNNRRAFDGTNEYALYRKIVEDDVDIRTGEDYVVSEVELKSRVAQLHARRQLRQRQLLLYQQQAMSMTPPAIGSAAGSQVTGGWDQNTVASSHVTDSYLEASLGAPSAPSMSLARSMDSELPSSALPASFLACVTDDGGASMRGVPGPAPLSPRSRKRFEQRAFEELSDAVALVNDLIDLLLIKEKEKRISGDSVLEHPFFSCPYVVSQFFYTDALLARPGMPTAGDAGTFVTPDFPSPLRVPSNCATGGSSAPSSMWSAGSPAGLPGNPNFFRPPGATGNGSLSAVMSMLQDGEANGEPDRQATLDLLLDEGIVHRPLNWKNMFLRKLVKPPFRPHLKSAEDLRYFPDAIGANGVAVKTETLKLAREKLLEKQNSIRGRLRSKSMGSLATERVDLLGLSHRRTPTSDALARSSRPHPHRSHHARGMSSESETYRARQAANAHAASVGCVASIDSCKRDATASREHHVSKHHGRHFRPASGATSCQKACDETLLSSSTECATPSLTTFRGASTVTPEKCALGKDHDSPGDLPARAPSPTAESADPQHEVRLRARSLHVWPTWHPPEPSAKPTSQGGDAGRSSLQASASQSAEILGSNADPNGPQGGVAEKGNSSGLPQVLTQLESHTPGVGGNDATMGMSTNYYELDATATDASRIFPGQRSLEEDGDGYSSDGAGNADGVDEHSIHADSDAVGISMTANSKESAPAPPSRSVSVGGGEHEFFTPVDPATEGSVATGAVLLAGHIDPTPPCMARDRAGSDHAAAPAVCSRDAEEEGSEHVTVETAPPSPHHAPMSPVAHFSRQLGIQLRREVTPRHDSPSRVLKSFLNAISTTDQGIPPNTSSCSQDQEEEQILSLLTVDKWNGTGLTAAPVSRRGSPDSRLARTGGAPLAQDSTQCSESGVAFAHGRSGAAGGRGGAPRPSEFLGRELSSQNLFHCSASLTVSASSSGQVREGARPAGAPSSVLSPMSVASCELPTGELPPPDDGVDLRSVEGVKKEVDGSEFSSSNSDSASDGECEESSSGYGYDSDSYTPTSDYGLYQLYAMGAGCENDVEAGSGATTVSSFDEFTATQFLDNVELGPLLGVAYHVDDEDDEMPFSPLGRATATQFSGTHRNSISPSRHSGHSRGNKPPSWSGAPRGAQVLRSENVFPSAAQIGKVMSPHSALGGESLFSDTVSVAGSTANAPPVTDPRALADGPGAATVATPRKSFTVTTTRMSNPGSNQQRSSRASHGFTAGVGGNSPRLLVAQGVSRKAESNVIMDLFHEAIGIDDGDRVAAVAPRAGCSLSESITAPTPLSTVADLGSANRGMQSSTVVGAEGQCNFSHPRLSLLHLDQTPVGWPFVPQSVAARCRNSISVLDSVSAAGGTRALSSPSHYNEQSFSSFPQHYLGYTFDNRLGHAYLTGGAGQDGGVGGGGDFFFNDSFGYSAAAEEAQPQCDGETGGGHGLADVEYPPTQPWNSGGNAPLPYTSMSS